MDNTSETVSYKCIDALSEGGLELPGIKLYLVRAY